MLATLAHYTNTRPSKFFLSWQLSHHNTSVHAYAPISSCNFCHFTWYIPTNLHLHSALSFCYYYLNLFFLCCVSGCLLSWRLWRTCHETSFGLLSAAQKWQLAASHGNFSPVLSFISLSLLSLLPPLLPLIVLSLALSQIDQFECGVIAHRTRNQLVIKLYVCDVSPGITEHVMRVKKERRERKRGRNEGREKLSFSLILFFLAVRMAGSTVWLTWTCPFYTNFILSASLPSRTGHITCSVLLIFHNAACGAANWYWNEKHGTWMSVVPVTRLSCGCYYCYDPVDHKRHQYKQREFVGK